MTRIGDHRYGVQVEEGRVTTSHQVTVPEGLVDGWGLPASDGDREERIVRESFEFLLEREPATSILREFSLDVIGRYFPEYEDELARRLA